MECRKSNSEVWLVTAVKARRLREIGYFCRMEIQHKDDGKKGSFFVENEGVPVAEMTYLWAGEAKIIIEHTEVAEALRGRQAGKKLLAAAVAFARERQLKIVPLCAFAAAQMSQSDAYQDVLF